jgi:hypothetical protein
MCPTLGADVPQDLLDRVDAEREEGESRSAATRRLVRDALDRDRAADRRPAAYLSFAAGLAYIVLSMFGPESALDPLFGIFIIAVGGWAVAPTWKSWLDARRP